LQWSTASESNSSYFEVMRSTDGINFKPIGKKEAKGTTNTLTNYSFIDNNPNNGFNYYRLGEADIDGKIIYSDVRLIKVAVGFSVTIYPNPTHSTLALNFISNKQKNLKVSIIDNQGKTIMQRQVLVQEGFSTHTLNVASLSNGLYYLKCISGDGDTELKFLKAD